MTESFTREKNLVEQLVGPLGLDADGYGGPSVGGADTDADMPGMTVPAEARTEKAVLAPDGGGRGMWGQNQLMDVNMVRPLVGSAREWAKP
jgi:hypothetical protein